MRCYNTLMSIYLMSGKDLYRLEQALKRILKENSVDRDHTVVFDASDAKNFRIDTAILECDTFSLFEGSDRKAVIIRDPFFLNAAAKTGIRGKKKEDKEEAEREKRMSVLEQYLRRPNPDTALVFYCHGFDADSRKKEYKLIEKYGAVITAYKKMYDRDFAIYCDEQLKKNKLTLRPDAKRELLARVDCDTLLLHNAIEKMLLYGEREYNLNDVRELVSLNPEVNVFNMSQQFIAGDLAGTIRSMNEMLKASFDHTSLMMMLASRIRSMYTLRKLYEKGMSESDIAMRLNMKPYAVKKGLENTRSLSSKKLLTYLCELAELDQGIKSGTIDPKEGFEQFILRNGKQYAGY